MEHFGHTGREQVCSYILISNLQPHPPAFISTTFDGLFDELHSFKTVVDCGVFGAVGSGVGAGLIRSDIGFETPV